MLTLGGNASPRGRRARACGSRRGCRAVAFIVVASVCVFGIGHRPCFACLVLLWLYATSGFSFGGLACLLRIGTGWVGGLFIPDSGFLTGGVGRRSVWSLFLSLLTSALETVGGGLFMPHFFLESIDAGLESISCTILLFVLSGNLWISLSFILAGRPALWCTMAFCFYYG